MTSTIDEGIVLIRRAGWDADPAAGLAGPGWTQIALARSQAVLGPSPRSRWSPAAPSPILRAVDFDPDLPWLWDGDAAGPVGIDPDAMLRPVPPAPSLAESPDLLPVLARRARRLRDRRAALAAADSDRSAPWLDERARRIVVAAVAAVAAPPDAAPPTAPPVPDPFASPAEFRAWLAAPVEGVNRYLRELHRERDDLREAFPGLGIDPAETPRFLRWAAVHAGPESGAPAWLLPTEPALLAADESAAAAGGGVVGARVARPGGGVRVIGYLGAVLGLGEAARLVVRAVSAAGEAVSTLDYRHLRGEFQPWTDHHDAPDHDVLVLCSNGPELPRLIRALGPSALAGRYRVGVWFWEGDRLPPDWVDALALLHEVWVTSEWTAAAVRRAGTAVPVHILPLGIALPPVSRVRPPAIARLVGPTGAAPVALAFWDYASTTERKNPAGMVAAWCRAFPEPGPARFVAKTIHAQHRRAEAEKLRVSVADRGDIVFYDAVLTADDQHALLASADALLSLHRAEGYGLGPLEAMARAVPLICTDATGTQEFTSPETAWLVPARATTLAHDAWVYPAGTGWFEPDIEVAAAHLRAVLRDPADPAVRARAERAAQHVAPLVRGDPAAAFVRARLAAIRSR